MKKSCQICGKPSGIYPLCIKHLEMKSRGEVVKCSKCNKWHLANVTCDCENKKEIIEVNTERQLPLNDTLPNKIVENICKECGKPSGTYALCNGCHTQIFQRH